MVGTITQAALAVMDKTKEFDQRFPQSARLAEVRRSVVETLATVFGVMGFPVPQNRAAYLEASTRKLLHRHQP